MKINGEIEDMIYEVIKGSILEQAIVSTGGILCKSEDRPVNSAGEDIVISVLDVLNGRMQDAVINVNIYVPMERVSVGFRKNRARIDTLSRLAIELLENYNGGYYLFEVESQKAFQVEGVNEHCINNRIKLTINNF